MNYLLVLTYGISLSMDAFAIAICKGIALGKAKWIDAVKVGLYFGIAQGLMPLIGYGLANSFSKYIERFDHWVAFFLLLYIGVNMIKESIDNEEEQSDGALCFKKMFVMAIATSIDALAVGIAFSCDGMPTKSNGVLLGIYASCLIICLTTFVLSALGVKLGKILENKFKSRAEFVGGIVLVLLGIKILVEHLWGFSIFGI